jgi:hypothetical protein
MQKQEILLHGVKTKWKGDRLEYRQSQWKTSPGPHKSIK